MRKIGRGDGSGDLSNAVLFKLVPELNMGDVRGFMEQWYSGKRGFDAIFVENEDQLTYAGIVSKGQGLYLGKVYFFGMNLQDKMYDSQSSLVNGAIVTQSIRRKEFGIRKDGEKSIEVGQDMPKIILTILAEKEDRVRETAKILKLPLEERV